MDCARAQVPFDKDDQYLPAPSQSSTSLLTLESHQVETKSKSLSDDCVLSDPPTQSSPKLESTLDEVYAVAVSKAGARHRARHNRRQSTKLLIFEALLGGVHPARSLIDCGSTATLLEHKVFTESRLHAAGITFRHTTTVIKTISGIKEQKSLEILDLPITFQGITRVIPRAMTADLGDAEFQVILGIDSLSQWDARTVYRNRRVEFPDGTHWSDSASISDEDAPELHCVHATEVFDLLKKGGEVIQVYLTEEGEHAEPVPPPPK